MKQGDKVPFKVQIQGAVKVNYPIVVRSYEDCLLVALDLHTKYATLECIGSGTDEGPSIFLGINDDTIKLDESKSKDMLTVVEFNTLKNWEVFSVTGPSKCSLYLTLLAPHT